MTELTPRQRAVYEALLARHARGEPSPTLEALCRALGLSSRGSLYKHVRALVAAGLVAPMEGRRGSGVRLTREGIPADEGLPLLGRIAAGRPIEAVHDAEPVQVPPFLRGNGPCYVLKVRGDSMEDAGILDGDWVVIEQRDQARNGEIVVALIDESEATLKRILQRPSQVVLYPASGGHTPQHYTPDRVRIQGVLVGQMRRY